MPQTSGAAIDDQVVCPIKASSDRCGDLQDNRRRNGMRDELTKRRTVDKLSGEERLPLDCADLIDIDDVGA